MDDTREPPYPREGQHMRVTEGPFTGFDGTVVSTDESHRRVQILVTFFGSETIHDLDVLQLAAMA